MNTQPLFRPGEAQPFAVVATFADITDMQRAEAELRESEERFRSLYEHAIDGVLLTAPDDAPLPLTGTARAASSAHRAPTA